MIRSWWGREQGGMDVVSRYGGDPGYRSALPYNTRWPVLDKYKGGRGVSNSNPFGAGGPSWGCQSSVSSVEVNGASVFSGCSQRRKLVFGKSDGQSKFMPGRTITAGLQPTSVRILQSTGRWVVRR